MNMLNSFLFLKISSLFPLFFRLFFVKPYIFTTKIILKNSFFVYKKI